MSFISIMFKTISYITNQSVYSIIDSEFGEIDVKVAIGQRDLVVAKVYSERNLPVGRNLALSIIYESKIHRTSMKYIIEDQNDICSKHLSNWEQLAKERDEHLEKLLALM